MFQNRVLTLIQYFLIISILIILFYSYDVEGHSKGRVRFEELPDPVRLRWDFSPKLEECIMSSYKVALNS